MPILVKDYTISQTSTSVVISTTLRSQSQKKVQASLTDNFLSISYGPFLCQVDLAYLVKVEESTTTITSTCVVCELQKQEKGDWDVLLFKGVFREIQQRRKESEERNLERQKLLKEAQLLEKRTLERALVQTQIDVEREKRLRVEQLKEAEKQEAADGIKEWASSLLESKRMDSAIFAEPEKQPSVHEQASKNASNPKDDDLDAIDDNFDEEFEDDEDIDVAEIRAQVRRKLTGKVLPPPRDAQSIEIQFSSRNSIPTKTARESEDAKWRLRIKLAEALQKKELDVGLLNSISGYMDKGHQFFVAGDYESAINAYNAVLELDSQHVKYMNLTRCLSNRAACWLKYGNPLQCIQDCTEALRIVDQEHDILTKELKGDDGNMAERVKSRIKLFCRRGFAYKSLEQKDKALGDYELALSMDRDNQALAHDVEALKV